MVLIKLQRHIKSSSSINATVEALTIDSTKYGYIIKQNKQVLIVQSFVPGVPGKLHFQSSDDALRVGELVTERLKAEISFSIMPKDLESWGFFLLLSIKQVQV